MQACQRSRRWRRSTCRPEALDFCGLPHAVCTLAGMQQSRQRLCAGRRKDENLFFLLNQWLVLILHRMCTGVCGSPVPAILQGLEKAAKGLTLKGFPATISCFTFQTVKLSAQWKRREMVFGVDDGPKTDWLLAALEKTLGLSSVCWSKLGIMK